MIVANDATVKGGTYYPLTVKKHLRAQEVAEQNCLPCIYLVDSGGAFLPLQDEVFPDRDHFGRIFFNQARMSAKGIAQIAVVMGSCTAGGAYVPAMSDETVIVKGTGTIFLGGPPLVKAATGEEVTAEELGGADVHSRVSGVTDHYAVDDEHALAIARSIVAHLATGEPEPPWTPAEPEAPLYDPAELHGIVPEDYRVGYDVREVIARLVDGSRFHEFKELYGETLVCGFARIEGFPSRSSPTTAFSSRRARSRAPTSFSSPASAGSRWSSSRTSRGSWLERSTRQAASRRTGRSSSRRSRAPRCQSSRSSSGARSARGTTECAVGPTPLASSGCGRTPGSASWAASRRRPCSPQSDARIPTEIREKYEREGSPYYSTARLWDDGVIDPADTRRVLALGLSASLNAPIPETTFGIFRM